MNFKGKDIININDFSRADLEKIFSTASEMESMPREKAVKLLEGYNVACLFFEPSTRTRLSFQSAAQYLGAGILPAEFNLKKKEEDMSSMSKGESFEDTIKTVDGYADVIVIRHPESGSAKRAADVAEHPVINAGDGTNEHPTQTMLDLYTMWKIKGGLDGMNIGMVGDLKYGRTPHSLSFGLARFNPKNIWLVSPPELAMPQKYIDILKAAGAEVHVVERIEDIEQPDIDFIYATRIQKERFPNPEEYKKYAGVYKIGLDTLKHFDKNVRIMHPLPRVDEIKPEIDEEPQAIYFEQARNGIFVRMALLTLVTGCV